MSNKNRHIARTAAQKWTREEAEKALNESGENA